MKILSHSVKNTLDLGRSIGRKLCGGEIILLHGELGSGKTVLAKGIASGLGISKDKVISPTFVLMRQYKAKIPFYHFDFYRLKGPGEILNLGYEEYFYSSGVTVIEWPERLKYLLPKEFLRVNLLLRAGNNRALELKAAGEKHSRILEEIDEDIRH